MKINPEVMKLWKEKDAYKLFNKEYEKYLKELKVHELIYEFNKTTSVRK